MAFKQQTNSKSKDATQLDSRVATVLGLEDVGKAIHLRKYLAKYSLPKLISVWFGDTKSKQLDPALLVAALPKSTLRSNREALEESGSEIFEPSDSKAIKNLTIATFFLE